MNMTTRTDRTVAEIKKLASELVAGLQSSDELESMARDGVSDNFFGDWSTERGIQDTAELRAAMQECARRALAAG